MPWDKHTTELAFTSPAFDEEASTRAAVQQLLYRLRPKDRECLWLFYYQEWSVDTIARHLHMCREPVDASTAAFSEALGR